MRSRSALPDRLQSALEGSHYDPDDSEIASLVRVAALARGLAPSGPDAAATQRLRDAFEATMARPVRPLWLRWLGSWIGAGPAPRPLVERLAAGLVLVSIAGSGAGAAAGVSPLDAAGRTVDFVQSLVANLDPRNGSGQPATETPAPSSTPAPATATPTSTEPAPTPTAGGSATPTPDDEDDDHSGRGRDDRRDDDDDEHREEDRRGRSGRDDGSDDNPSPDEDRP